VVGAEYQWPVQELSKSWWLHSPSCRATACSCTATARDAMIVGGRVGCVEGLQGRATDCRAFVLAFGKPLWSLPCASLLFPKLALAFETCPLRVSGHTGGVVSRKGALGRVSRGVDSPGFGGLQLTPHRDCACSRARSYRASPWPPSWPPSWSSSCWRWLQRSLQGGCPGTLL